MTSQKTTIALFSIVLFSITISGWAIWRQHETRVDAEIWRTISETKDPRVVTLFLGNYPDSKHQADAIALLKELLEDPAFDAQAQVAEPTVAHRGDTQPRNDIDDISENSSVTRASPDLISVPSTPLLEPDPERGSTHGLRLSSATLRQLLSLKPKYPPIEGLREDVWVSRQCLDCHQWTAQDLCTQAGMYTSERFDPAQEGRHPLGVDFKLAMRQWAIDGCY